MFISYCAIQEFTRGESKLPHPRIVLVSIIFAVILVGVCFIVGQAAAAASPSGQGYVTYKVTLARGSIMLQSVVVNETAQPTGNDGLVQLSFLLSSQDRNLSYSRIVNSSSVPEIFPYIVGLNNQSVSYSNYGVSLNAKIVHDGTVSVTFNGHAYTAQRYTVTLAFSRLGGETYSASGEILTVPSGLLYSAELQTMGVYSLTVNLAATDLPLTAPPSGNIAMFGFALVGLGLAGAVGLAVPSVFALVRLKTRHGNNTIPMLSQTKSSSTVESNSFEKPSHWVD